MDYIISARRANREERELYEVWERTCRYGEAAGKRYRIIPISLHPRERIGRMLCEGNYTGPSSGN
jgi:hypothetical protein